MPQQHEEDDGNRHYQCTDNLRHALAIVLYLSAILHLHTIRQLEVGQTLLYYFGDFTNVHSTCHFRHHCYGAQTIAVGNLSVLPGGHNGGKLAHRHTGQCLTHIMDAQHSFYGGGDGSQNTNGDEFVHYVVLRSLVGVVGLHHDINAVVTFPCGADGQTVAIAISHLHFDGLVGDAQT